MSLNQFDRGIDYSGLRLPSVGDPARFGARFVVRYSAGAGNDHAGTQWKLCGRDELRSLVAAGYDFLANSEWTAGRIEEGPAAGRDDGLADLAFWQSRGLARTASIYVSWDQGQPNVARHAAVAQYLTAYEAALGGYYHVDLYAGDVAIAAMLNAHVIRYGWRAMADSWSGNGNWYQPGDDWLASARRLAEVSPAHLAQNGNRWYGGQADEDVILRLPVGSHLEALAGGS
jgi:Domain of unknown function (DUF1906)